MREYRVQLASRLRSARLGHSAEPLPERPVRPAVELPPLIETTPIAVIEIPSLPPESVPAPAPEPAPPPMPVQDDNWPRIEAAFAAIEDQLQQRRKQSLGELQQAAVELAIAVASRMVHERIAADDFPVEKLVGELLNRCGESGPVDIHLHPTDLELLERRVQGRTPPWTGHESYTLIADASLERGDCRVAAGEFGILAKLELQLSELRQHLLESLDDAQVERRRTQTGNRAFRRFPERRETA
jgi:hypothetical protein